MRREVSKRWMGKGKKECRKATIAMCKYIRSHKLDKLYDEYYVVRTACYIIGDRDAVRWANYTGAKLEDYIDMIYHEMKTITEADRFYIAVFYTIF